MKTDIIKLALFNMFIKVVIIVLMVLILLIFAGIYCFFGYSLGESIVLGLLSIVALVLLIFWFLNEYVKAEIETEKLDKAKKRIYKQYLKDANK